MVRRRQRNEKPKSAWSVVGQGRRTADLGRETGDESRSCGRQIHRCTMEARTRVIAVFHQFRHPTPLMRRTGLKHCQQWGEGILVWDDGGNVSHEKPRNVKVFPFLDMREQQNRHFYPGCFASRGDKNVLISTGRAASFFGTCRPDSRPDPNFAGKGRLPDCWVLGL